MRNNEKHKIFITTSKGIQKFVENHSKQIGGNSRVETREIAFDVPPQSNKQIPIGWHIDKIFES